MTHPHGLVLRVLVARGIGLSAGGGQHFLLGTGTLCVLSYYRDIPAVRVWNRSLRPEPVIGHAMSKSKKELYDAVIALAAATKPYERFGAGCQARW
jgi:hypothetical protein